MFKRISTLVVISSLISAVLLYLGINVMEKYTPALASSISALVAAPGARASSQNNAEEGGVSQAALPGSGVATAAQTVTSGPAVVPVSGDEPGPSAANNPNENEMIARLVRDPEKYRNQVVALSGIVTRHESGKLIFTDSAGQTLIETDDNITIAELLSDPERYRNQVIALSGMVTSLEDDKFLLNDGTGQILVEIDDHAVSSAAIDGLTITVVGGLDDFISASASVLELDACSLEYQGNVVFIDDDCLDDGDHDDDDDVDDDDDDLDDDDDDDDDHDDDDDDDHDDDDHDDDDDDDEDQD